MQSPFDNHALVRLEFFVFLDKVRQATHEPRPQNGLDSVVVLCEVDEGFE
jgi:hypothetical protein